MVIKAVTSTGLSLCKQGEQNHKYLYAYKETSGCICYASLIYTVPPNHAYF